MKKLILLCLFTLSLAPLAGAEDITDFTSDVNPMEPDVFHSCFNSARLESGKTLVLRLGRTDESYQIRVGDAALRTVASHGRIELLLGTDARLFSAQSSIRFLAFPASAPKKYLFLVEKRNPQGLTQVGLLMATAGQVEEVPIATDCARCLHHMELEVASGSYRYGTND